MGGWDRVSWVVFNRTVEGAAADPQAVGAARVPLGCQGLMRSRGGDVGSVSRVIVKFTSRVVLGVRQSEMLRQELHALSVILRVWLPSRVMADIPCYEGKMRWGEVVAEHRCSTRS